MLARSKQNATLMAGIAAGCYAVTELLVSLAVEYRASGSFPSLNDPNAVPPGWVLLVLLAAALVAATILGGKTIYALFKEEVYYGAGGAVRWGCLGVSYALILHLSRWVGASLSDSVGLQGIVEIALFATAYLVIFKILPLVKNFPLRVK